MSQHDPIQFLRLLKDHLAHHERPTSFLFGAGTSCCVNIAPLDATGKQTSFIPLIPAIIPLTLACKKAVEKLGLAFGKAWTDLEAECTSASGLTNIEIILSRVRLKMQALGDSDTSCGLVKGQLKQLEQCITKAILDAVNVADDQIPDALPHDKFARWAGGHARSQPLEVFTPNYDLLVELSLEKALVPVFDGFAGAYRPFFMPELVEREDMMPSREWVRVWKIHGSVNWEISETAAGTRICRTSTRSGNHLILPSHLKYDESRKQPYLAMLGRLSKLINREDALLVMCGYSFSDDHINAAILESLQRRRRAHAFHLSYSPLTMEMPAVKAALNLQNLTVVGPDSAVIGGRFEKWSANIDNENALADSISDAFELPKAATATEPYVPGRLLLGDFNHFCSFLGSMTD